ncbi:MAG: hypothetical protein IH956_06930 [Chloroflexi bacterium]|nr:hypothetical protein [Chloroflexota bacterium]
MTEPRITKDTLRAMAAASGLELTDQQLDELLPQAQRSVEGLKGLEALDLQDIEPAVTFKVDRD